MIVSMRYRSNETIDGARFNWFKKDLDFKICLTFYF